MFTIKYKEVLYICATGKTWSGYHGGLSVCCVNAGWLLHMNKWNYWSHLIRVPMMTPWPCHMHPCIVVITWLILMWNMGVNLMLMLRLVVILFCHVYVACHANVNICWTSLSDMFLLLLSSAHTRLALSSGLAFINFKFFRSSGRHLVVSKRLLLCDRTCSALVCGDRPDKMGQRCSSQQGMVWNGYCLPPRAVQS